MDDVEGGKMSWRINPRKISLGQQLRGKAIKNWNAVKTRSRGHNPNLPFFLQMISINIILIFPILEGAILLVLFYNPHITMMLIGYVIIIKFDNWLIVLWDIRPQPSAGRPFSIKNEWWMDDVEWGKRSWRIKARKILLGQQLRGKAIK